MYGSRVPGFGLGLLGVCRELWVWGLVLSVNVHSEFPTNGVDFLRFR